MKSKTRKKRTPLAIAKDNAWTWMSRYIRLRDSDAKGMCKCVTCDTRKPWRDMQAGHFIPAGRGNAVRWNETNVHGQCMRCNVNLGSNGPEYFKFMVKTYGQDFVDDLIIMSHSPRKISIQEYREKAYYYENSARELGYEI